MNITVHIPDEMAERLAAEGGDLERRALEAFAVAEYQAGRLFASDLGQLLGLSRYEVDGFLKERGKLLTGSASERVPGIVADTGPLQYLVLIGEIDLLPRLFRVVAIPAVVQAEMLHPEAPDSVRSWAGAPPQWLTIAPGPTKGGADPPPRRR